MQEARLFLMATSRSPGLMQKEGKHKALLALAWSPPASLPDWCWEISAKVQAHHLSLVTQKHPSQIQGSPGTLTTTPALGLSSISSSPLSLENVGFTAHSKPCGFISSRAFTTRIGNQLGGPSGFQYHGEKRCEVWGSLS